MKFTCSLCGTKGEIRPEDTGKPVNRATCENCGAILFLDPDGRVEKHKSPVKDTSRIRPASTQGSDSVMDVPGQSGTRDWLAIAVVGLVVALLCAAGIYVILYFDLL
ncbi:MAG TPA: hypothetical protein ACFCUC_14450 [Desulfobacterales bacterium]